MSAYQKPTLKDLSDTRQKFLLPDTFIFYPAQTWPHKNHVGLLKAIEIMRERFGMVVPVVFAGSIYESCFKEIQHQIEKLSLSEQTHILGFVTPLELQCLYQLARCVVIPTKYEAGSFPLWEAFLSGVPAACSNVTSLPAQAGDAALFFDPDQPEEMADAIVRLWKDESLRQKLIDRGYQNVARYSWQLTARTFRAYYRQIAKRFLTEEDLLLLKAPPLM
jgi:glycosyltransferase involved in cell wall biosynthesis